MKAFREKNKFNRIMLWITLFSFVTQPLIVSAQTIADSSDGTATPVIDRTVNGTELVHIARPHTDGVSQNLYLEFNVSSDGLILNNNATNAAVSTSQGEGVIPNFNFQGGNAASVILNEVTGGNLSSLLGDLEIAGAGAELIIANENGITCNGCGFINSTQTTLTTGKTVFDNSGNLTAFRVTDGMIDIGTEGLDASLSQSLNLLANGINVNGPVWANNLQAVAGQNNIDSETLSNTAIVGTVSTTPLIDIGSLGGMYAKQIFLVTTGSGTGVNNSGEIGASVGDLIITSDGKLKSKGSLSAQSSITLNATEIDNQGSISSRTNMALQAGSVDNVGNITSLADIAIDANRLDNEGLVSSKGRTDIETTGGVSNIGEINSATMMNISAFSIDNTGAINVEKGGLTLNSQQHINNTDTAKIVVESGSVVIKSASEVNNGGIISLDAGSLTIDSGHVNNTSEINLESGDLSITSQIDTDNTGTINLENGDATISSEGVVSNAGDIHLEVGSLVITSQDHFGNTGRINLEAGDLLITSQQNIDNTGKINIKAGDANVTAQRYLNNTGEIISDTGAIDISATELINAGDISSQENQSIIADVNNTGLISSKKKLTITTQGELSNNGTIASVELLDITSAIVHNAINGRILAKNFFNITATDISNQNEISFFGGLWNTEVWSNEGAIQNKDNAFVLNSASLDNSGIINNINSDFTATSDTTLVNSGTIKSEGNLFLLATNDIDNSGKVASNGSMTLSTQGNISNTPKNNTANSTIEAADLTLIGAEVINDSIIKSANDITVNATQRFNNNDRLTLAGDLIVDTSIFSNLGLANISVGKGMTLNSTTFSNAADAAILTGTGDLSISTASVNNNSFDNNGRIETLNGNMNILVNGNTTQDGELISAAGLYFYSGLTGFNFANGNVTTTGKAEHAGVLFNRGIIQSGSNLKLGFSGITNDKTISSNNSLSAIYSLGDITNRKDIYGESGLSIISQGTLNNTGGSAITSLDALAIDVAGNINNSGFIIGNAELDIDANKLENIDGFISGGLVNIDVNTLKNDASSGMFSTKKMDIQSGSGGVDNYGEIYSFSDLDITLDTWGAIYNRQNASIKSKGNMLLGVDCVGASPCNLNYRTTFDNRSLVQADLSIELNSYTFLNKIDSPTLGDWRVTDYDYTDQNFSGRYSCSSIFCHYTSWGYYFETTDGYSDWRNDKTEYREINSSLIAILPTISAGSEFALRTNDGKNQGGVLEARSKFTMELLDGNRSGSFINTAITTSETKTSYEEGRYRFTCHYKFPFSCEYRLSEGAVETNGWKDISTTQTTAGGVIRAGSIVALKSDSGKKIALKNINGATSDEGYVGYSNVVNKIISDTPTVDLVNSSEINDYADTIPDLGKLPDNIQSVSSATGIDFDVNTGSNTNSNGLFVESSAPDREFLYVLNPRIPTDSSTQIGTDYLLEKMDVDIGNILRLGDASYEQQIIEQQIAMQASSRWITDAETVGEQLTILMDNGIEFAENNGLLVGESLTDEQVFNLEKDLVWLEYSYLNGEIVLIPVVYLTQETKKQSAGAILAETIQMDVDTLGNDGGTIAATGDATIIAQGDIENIGGTIAADNLAIVSTEGSIINESVIHRIGTEDNFVETATEALISANNDLILSANQNIEILGATVEAGHSAVVHAENGDVNVTSLVLESKTTTESHTKSGLFSSEHTKTVTTEQTQQTAGINVGGDMNYSHENADASIEQNPDQNQGGLLIYAASGTVNLTGADISSTDDIAIFADDVVTSILALHNITTTETHSSGFSIGGGGIGVYSNDSHSEGVATTASGTTISAGGNLLVDAVNDIILEGGSISADTGAFNAGNNFTTLAAADTNSTRENSSESQAGIQVGGGGISGSASTTTSSASTDSTLYTNVDMQFEDGVSITARDTVDIGGLDLAVINVAEVIEPEPVPAANAENEEQLESAEQPEPQTSEIVEVDEATDSNIADIRSHLNTTALVAQIVSGTSDISTVAALTSEAIKDIQPEIALGSATITGDKVISTKFENTYNETSSTSTTSVGFSAGASDNGDGTSSVSASIGGGTSSASASTDILAENMNTISAGDLTISGKQSVDLVGVDLSGQDSVTLTSEGDINITAAKYNQSTTSSSSDTSFGISAGISVRNGEEPDENTLENAIKPLASASLGFAYNDSNEQSSATSLGHVDSVILSQGNVTIQSGDGDIEFKGVSVVSDSTTIEGNSFSSAAFEDSFTSDESSSQTGVSFTASTDIVEMGKSIFEGNGAQSLDVDAYGSQEVGNTLISNNLTIDVKNDVTIVGGDISAGQINIAANTVDIKAAQSVYHEERVESKVSLGGDVRASLGGESVHASYDTIDGGKSDSSSNNDPVEPGQGHNGKAVSSEVVGADIGLTIKNTETTTDSTTYQNASIQFTDLVIDTTDKTDTGRGDGHVDIGGANLFGITNAEGEEPVASSIAITTGEVKTTKFVDTTTTTVHDTSTFIGYTAEGHSAVADMYNHEEALQAKQAEGMTIDEGLHAAQLAADTTNLAMGDLAGGTAGVAIRHNTTDSTSTSTSENINYLNASNISITTTEGNIDLKGVEFNGPPSTDAKSGKTVATTQARIESIALNSAQDVNITAAKSTFTETSTTTSHNVNASGYASASAMGSSVGLDVGYNGNTETNTLDQTTYSNAQMNADNITITGQNLSLTGANVSGGNVNLDLDNNINITSVQDTQTKTTTRANWGGSVGASAGTYGLAPSVNVQGGGGDSHDNHALTKQQSGVQAENNLTVQAGGDLTLTGAHVGVDEGGSGSVDVAGNLVSNKLDDYRDQAGLFGGGGGGFDAGGVNANVNLEVVDKIDQQTTQNSTISGVELTVAGTTSGDNLNNGQLQTEQTTIVKDEKIAGIMIVASGFAPKPNKKGAASGGPAATMPTNSKGQQKNKAVTDAANAITAKPPKQANGNKTTESVVVVIPANKNGTQQDNVVQTAADAVANKQTDKDRNVVVVKENQDGSLQVVKGDMETVTGNTKIDVVSHGSTLKDNGAESVAALIKKVADESGLTDSNKNSDLTKVNLTACGDCNKTDGKTIGEQVTTQLASNGIAPKVKEHNSKIQVTDSGNVMAFNDKNATTLTHQIENGKLTTAVKAEKNLSGTPLKNTLDGDDVGAAPKSATENLSDKTKGMRPTEDVKALSIATSKKADKVKYSPEANYSNLDTARMSGSRSLEMPTGIRARFMAQDQKQAIIDKQTQWRETEVIARQGASEVGLKATPEDLNGLIIALNAKATEGTAKAGKVRNEARGGGLLPPEHISTELSNFTNWLSGALAKVDAGIADPIIVAAKAGQRLNTIHPFGDGNGRVVNLTIDFILLSSGLPPSSAGHPPKHVDTQESGTPEQNQAALDAAVAAVRDGVEKSIAILEKDAAAALAKLSEDDNGKNKGLDGKGDDDKSDDSKDAQTKIATDSVVVVIPASKDGKTPDAVVQDAAIAVANKQASKDRNVVVLKENQDGSLQVAQGDMATVTGNTKIDVVSHGSTLKDNGAESVAALIKKVADESGLTDSNKNSDLTKVNLTACGDCNKTGGKTIGEQVTTQLVDKGLTPSVKEHDSKVQVQKDGTVVAFNNKSNAAKTLTHQVKEGVVVTATQTKNKKHLTDEPLQSPLVKGDEDKATNGQWVDGQSVDVNGLPFTMNISHESDQQAQARIDNLNAWLPTERKIIQQTQAQLQNPNSNVFKQSSHMVHDQRGEIARHINEAPIKPLTQSEVSLKVSDHKETLDDAGIIQLLNEIKNTGEAIFVQKLMAENSTLPKFEVDTASNLSPEIQHKQYQDKVLTDHIKTLDEKNQMKLVEEISSIGERLIAEQLVLDKKIKENVEWVTTKRPQDGSTAYKETMALMASGAEGPLTMAQAAQGAQAAAAGYQILSKDDGAIAAGIKNKEIAQEQVPASYMDRKTVNDIVAPIKAVRDVDPDPVAQNKALERAEKTDTAYRAPVSHPTASKHGVILANDPGTQSRDAHGLPIMTGTSGTTASMTRSVIRSRATNDAVDKKTPVNAETLQKLSIAAEGLSDMQAADAVKDLALTWMRDGAFSQALKTGIDGRLKKTDDAYQSVNEDPNRVQTHSYPEVAEGFDRTMNLKNKDQREIKDQIDASSKESLDRLKANKAKYDSAVVVMTRDKDGEISTAVKGSADDIKQQYPDTVVLIQNQDGSVDVGVNGEKLKNIKGDTRIDVIGHGTDLKDKGADQVASLIDQVTDEIKANENETKVTRAEIVACGDCAKDGEKTFGQQVVEKMTSKDVAVAEHDTPIQVNQDGSRTALKVEGSQPKKIITTKTDQGVTTRTRDKQDSEMAAELDSARQLTLYAKESGVPRGFEGVPLVATVVKAGADTDTQYHVVTQGTLEAANDKAYRENTGLENEVGRIRNGKFERKAAKADKGDAVVHISRRGSVRLSKGSANGGVSYTRISSGATSDAIRAAKTGTDFAFAAQASLLNSDENLPNAAKMTTTEVAADGITPINTTVATAISGDGIQSTGDDHQATMARLTQANTEGRRRKKEATVQKKERLLKEHKALIKSKQKEINNTKAGSKRDELVTAQKKRELKLPAKRKALKDEQDLLDRLDHSPMQDSHSEPLATALTNQARAVNGMSQLHNADTVSLVTSVNRAVCAWCGDGFVETTNNKDGSLTVGEAWVPFQHSRTGFDEENNSFLYRILPHQQRVDSAEALQAEVEEMRLIYRYAAGQGDHTSQEMSNDDFSILKNAVEMEED